MGKTEIRNICPVSLETPAASQPQLHNRWHPDVPFAGKIKDGETVKIECVCFSSLFLTCPELTSYRLIGLVDRLVCTPPPLRFILGFEEKGM